MRLCRRSNPANPPAVALLTKGDSESGSLLLPTFVARLADPAIRTVMLCGCGGGFEFIDTHSVDAIVLVDRGSDSLMTGDEEGLGDPIEDAVSVAAVASLRGLRAKVLIFGRARNGPLQPRLGCRFASRCRGVDPGGRLPRGRQPGALGSGSGFYRDCGEHIYERQGFRSVLASTIASAIQGWFGRDAVPTVLEQRVRPGELFFSPLMAVL